ncbi:MAG: tRNA (adenosine(37)-N6)-threonylcarbamoyltransferase complex transferase subunit TsaD [Caldisericia bacterium]|nr:tRNA (adenosine(37)-N6)-threonylcarbamoyltransferase complex transferase subunit TsaD [Caldisericia bacterium]MDD4614050.1 tRNA (adenosine(37)-N6)-threonylcarbamoyltransferase complex transferase subunit TsaD [Caldisericia bacterium]
MFIVGIETSCDDTAASIINEKKEVMASILSSQTSFHAKYGGIVPEIASRKHLELISHVCQEALQTSCLRWTDIDLICVTKGPGLVGSLLVGVEYAKALSLALNTPIKGVHHIEGHLLSPSLTQTITYPYMGLIVSGGHTEFVHVPKAGIYQIVGSTVDDACGESLDKFGKSIGIPYPAGPIIEQYAARGEDTKFSFPLPSVRHRPYDMSFSGLKTAVLHVLQKLSPNELENEIWSLCASYQRALFYHITTTAQKILASYPSTMVLLSGGVSANQTLFSMLQLSIDIPVLKPGKGLSTDNAAMIAWAGYLRYMAEGSDSLNFEVQSSLELESYAVE